MTKVSVAMATYNGERFIAEQLASIAGQTHPPDEIVICDDTSTDQTLSIVEEFASQTTVEVRRYVNDERLGVRGNFEQALSLCTGDVIFLSDQDDVWLPDKIRLVLELLDLSPEIDVVVNDLYLANSRLDYNRTQLQQIRAVWGMSEDKHVAGCATAIRSSFRDLALPIPVGLDHDAWLHALARAIDRRLSLEVPLQIFRRHGANDSNPLSSLVDPIRPWTQLKWLLPMDPRTGTERRYRLTRNVRDRYLERIAGPQGGSGRPDPILERLNHETSILQDRRDLLSVPRPRRILRIANHASRGGYRYFGGFLTLMKDLFWR